MADSAQDLLSATRRIVAADAPRQARATQLAEAIRTFGGYRWVGVYVVGKELVSIIAWSGPGAPAHPTFPVTEGLTGSAIGQKATVVVGDVRKDPRYLTAFDSTLSEIIIPIIHPQKKIVVGTIDVESERANAFFDEDRKTLERCAEAAQPLWNEDTDK
jgi:putative methionine-R-sulfoxide reductase with GAF domain